MKQYLKALKYVLDKGVDRADRTGVGTRAVFGMQMRFDMAEGFPAVTTKKLAFNSMKAELLWFISGSNDAKELQKLGSRIWDANVSAPYWSKKASFPGDVGRIYGVQWRKWKTYDSEMPVDQLKLLIEEVKKDPYSRRHIMSAWNPSDLEKMVLPPCHILSQLFVANGRISLQMYQRSCDMFLGVPFNIASYSLLLHMIAQMTGFKPGEFIHTLGDAHIYLNHIEQVKTQLERKPFPLPELWLNPDIRDIDGFKMEDIKLLNYQHHPSIKAPMAV